MSNANWLSTVDGAKYIHELVLPGSHDAGVYRDDTTGKDITLKTSGISTARVRCQGMSILNQAVAGSRFFDCRVYLRSFPIKKVVNGKTVKEQQVPTLGHFFKDTKEGMGGGYGGSLVAVIQDAISFVRDHPTEFIILRFSHTKCTDEVADALETLYDMHDYKGFIFVGDVNIAQCRLRDLRGKVVMAFDSKFNKQRLASYQEKKTLQALRSVSMKAGRGLSAKGMHLFKKYQSGSAAGNGLCTCGEFASSDNVKKVFDASVQAAKAHRDHGEDHLCFVYWQLTGGLVEANTTGPKGTHVKLDGFLQEVVKNALGSGKMPNVVSHDFVNDTTCAQIISLNGDRKAVMAQWLAKQV